MPPKAKQVYLMVTDIDDSITFYEDTLGLPCIKQGERSASFDTGACTLKVEREFDEQTLEMFGLTSPEENRGDGVVIVLDVDDVDTVYDTATDAGATTLIEPRDVDWGRRLFLIKDPDGYVLEVSEALN